MDKLGDFCFGRESQDKEYRKHVFLLRVRGGSRKLNLKCFGYELPHGSINQAELSNAHKPLPANSSPLLRRTLPMAFASGTEASNKMDLVFPGPSFLNDKQGRGKKKSLGKQITIWLEAQTYASEMMLQNYKRSGRLCALIKKYWPNLETESGIHQHLWSLSFTAVLVTGDIEQCQPEYRANHRNRDTTGTPQFQNGDLHREGSSFVWTTAEAV